MLVSKLEITQIILIRIAKNFSKRMKGPDHSGARFDSFGAFLADFWVFQIFPFGPPHETMNIKVV